MDSVRAAWAAVTRALARGAEHDADALSAGAYVAIWILALLACAALIALDATPAALVVLALSAVAASIARPREPIDVRARIAIASGVAGVLLAALLASDPVAQVETVLAFVPIAALCALLGAWSRERIERMVDEQDRAFDVLVANERRARVAMIRMQDLRETVDEAHWEADDKLRLRYVSPAFERIAELPPQSVLGLDPLDIAERYLGRYGRVGVCAARMESRAILDRVRLVWCDRARRRRYVTVCGVPRFSDAGAFVGYRGVMFAASRRA